MLQDKLCTHCACQAVTPQCNNAAELRLDSIARHVDVHVQNGGELASPGCLVVWAWILAAVNIVRLSPLRSQLGTLPFSWVNIRPSRARCFSRASTSNLPPNSTAGYSPPSSILTITSCSVGMSITVSARHQHIIRSQPDLLINRRSKGRKQVR